MRFPECLKQEMSLTLGLLTGLGCLLGSGFLCLFRASPVSMPALLGQCQPCVFNELSWLPQLYNGCLIILWVSFQILFSSVLAQRLSLLEFSVSVCAFFTGEKGACDGSECIYIYMLVLFVCSGFPTATPTCTHTHIYVYTHR